MGTWRSKDKLAVQSAAPAQVESARHGPQELTAVPQAKYPRPKVLVVDAPDACEALEKRGYAATSGTFGCPMTVPSVAGYAAIRSFADLPGHTEQEVVIVDLLGPEAIPGEGKLENPAHGVEAIWAPAASGLIEPRPLSMLGVRTEMDRIYTHGGIFILFSAPRFQVDYLVAKRYSNGIDEYDSKRLNASNWSMLSELNLLGINSDTGEEMDAADNGIARSMGIDGYFNSGRFFCTINPPLWSAERWFTLATNKYGEPVAGMLAPPKGEEKTGGLIFILPHLERRTELVTHLMEHVLPEFRPRLFPQAEGSRWTRRVEYELPQVAALKTEIIQAEEEMRARIRKLEEKIAEERAAYGFLHELLTATGDDLVQAVTMALGILGFSDVRDADAEAVKAGQSGPLREDLQIMDAPVPVLVEVKGIAGLPKEASSLQVSKYLLPRMRDWGRTDLHGLVIVNHQRNLPALEREAENVFQPDVVTNAEQQGFGLLTTWDLFRLARGFIAHKWRHEDIAPLFVSRGRIRPIPLHYEYIGFIDGYWPEPSALGIRLESGSLHVGDRVAYEQSVDFIEEEVTSLRTDDPKVDMATVGDYPGVKTALTKEQARKHVKVYKVKPFTDDTAGAGQIS